MISVTINGRKYELEGPTRLVDYLESRGLAGRRIAVAVNGTVLRREEFDGVTLADGDTLEIVRPVGGGQLSCPGEAAGGRVVSRGAG